MSRSLCKNDQRHSSHAKRLEKSGGHARIPREWSTSGCDEAVSSDREGEDGWIFDGGNPGLGRSTPPLEDPGARRVVRTSLTEALFGNKVWLPYFSVVQSNRKQFTSCDNIRPTVVQPTSYFIGFARLLGASTEPDFRNAYIGQLAAMSAELPSATLIR